MFLSTASQTAILQSIRIESIFFSPCGAFVSDQVAARQDWNGQFFDLDDLTVLISIIEPDAADGGYDINPSGRDADLKDDAWPDKGSLVDVVKRGAKRRQ